MVGFDVNGGIHCYNLVDLTRAHLINTSLQARFTPSPDGVIYGVREEGIFKASVFSGEFRPVPPPIFVEGLSMPAPPKSGGVLKSFFGKQAVDLDVLCMRLTTFHFRF